VLLIRTVTGLAALVGGSSFFGGFLFPFSTALLMCFAQAASRQRDRERSAGIAAPSGPRAGGCAGVRTTFAFGVATGAQAAVVLLVDHACLLLLLIAALFASSGGLAAIAPSLRAHRERCD